MKLLLAQQSHFQTAARMPRWAVASLASPCLSLLLQLLLLCLLSPSSLAQNMSGYFHVIGPVGGGWEPREKGNAEYVAKTTTFYDGNQERPFMLTNYLLVYGGSGSTGAALTDVWASSDGVQWVWAAGSSSGYSHPRYPTTFAPSVDVCHCQDVYYTQYRAGGYRGNTIVNDVWRSSNGYQWSVVCSAAQWRPRYLGNMAGDAAGNIFLAGGIFTFVSGQTRQTGSDVWRSSNGGMTWRIMRADGLLTGPGKRAVAVLLSPAADTLAWMSGVNPSLNPDPYLSDVWVSKDGGASFGLSTGSGEFPSTFPPRDDANGELTANGLFVVAAGYRPRPDEIFNDVWVSGNGGFTWSLCVEDAEWSDRRYLMTVVDGQGYFYVMGGAGLGSVRYNDVWKSSFTFNNLTAVSAMCRATYAFAPLVPSCGAGLKCFPQDSSTYLQFAVFPSCPACPLPINLIA